MLYIFKDKNNRKCLRTEQEAHMELRNKGAWQRQDFVYLGGVNITNQDISKAMEAVKVKAKEELLNTDDNIQNLKLRLEVAQGKKEDVTVISLLQSEIKLAESNTLLALKKNDNFTAEEERISTQYLGIISKLEQEYIDSLEIVQGVAPRDFNKTETRLSGKEINPSQ